jgi:thioredoxin-related protein
LTALAALFLPFAGSRAGEDKIVWAHDLDAARKEAKTAKKDLLILFTGRGWCAHCDILDREVFQQASFAAATKADYVFVELDFTFEDNARDRARAQRYRKLQDRYLVRSFPTVVLADADGVPYAIRSGYLKGTGVLASLAMLRLARSARAQRDQSFARAATVEGAERVGLLHRGIQAVAGMLGSLDERGDDPVLVFYRPQVQAILDADRAAGTIRASYEARRKKRDSWLAQEAVFSRLRQFDAAQDYRAALAYLDEQMKKTDDRALLWRMEQARQTHLEWDGQYGEALKNVRRLAGRPGLSEREREWLLDCEAYNLLNLGRADDLLAHYDRRIAVVGDHPVKRLGLLRSKALATHYLDRPKEARAAWRAYREAARRGSEEWLEATQELAGQLRKAGRHRAALELVSEYLAVNKAAMLLLDAAESHLALGDKDQAGARIRQAEAACRPLENSTNDMDRKTAAFIQKRLKSLQAKLEADKPR